MSLPQFAHDPEPALAAARRAEEAGLDGVFVFDHMWPLGRPDRPVLHSTTLLGAVVAETRSVTVGTLVARVGLVPDEVLVRTLATLDAISDGRLIAGVGAGDSLSRPENEAYGLDFPPAKARIAQVISCVRGLREAGVRTWVGGLSPAVRAAALEAGADGWNGWGVSPADFADMASGFPPRKGFEVTWGGQVLVGRTREEAEAKLARHRDRPGLVTGTVDDLARHLRSLAALGATWTVCSPIDYDLDSVVAAAELARGPEPETPPNGGR